MLGEHLRKGGPQITSLLHLGIFLLGQQIFHLLSTGPFLCPTFHLQHITYSNVFLFSPFCFLCLSLILVVTCTHAKEVDATRLYSTVPLTELPG